MKPFSEKPLNISHESGQNDPVRDAEFDRQVSMALRVKPSDALYRRAYLQSVTQLEWQQQMNYRLLRALKWFGFGLLCFALLFLFIPNLFAAPLWLMILGAFSIAVLGFAYEEMTSEHDFASFIPSL